MNGMKLKALSLLEIEFFCFVNHMAPMKEIKGLIICTARL
jgi:hypothetical protein